MQKGWGTQDSQQVTVDCDGSCLIRWGLEVFGEIYPIAIWKLVGFRLVRRLSDCFRLVVLFPVCFSS